MSELGATRYEVRSAPLEPAKARFLLGDVVVAFFIFTTITLPDGNPLLLASRLTIIAYFLLGLASGRPLRFNSFTVSSGFFLSLCAFSYFWSISPQTSLLRINNLFYVFASLFAFTNIISWKPDRLKSVFTLVILSALAGCAYVFLVQGVTFQDNRQVDGTTASGQIAFACAAGISVSVSRLSERFRLTYLFSIIILFSFMFLTSGRRGLIIAVSFILIYQLLEPRWSIRTLARLVGGAFLMLLGYLIIMNVPILYEHIGYRLEAFVTYVIAGDIVDASISGRDRLIQLGLVWFAESPFVGHGIDSFRALFSDDQGAWNTSADNNYIELMTSLGILGLAAYYIPLIVFIFNGIGTPALRRCPEHRFSIAFMASMSLVDFSQVWIYSKTGVLMIVICYLAARRTRTPPSLQAP
jgi:O-antigen ligase